MSTRGPRRPARRARHRPEGAAPAHRTRTFPPGPGEDGSPLRSPGGEWLRALREKPGERPGRGWEEAGECRVDEVTVSPGRITAPVYGAGPRPYLASLRLRVLEDAEWRTFLEEMAADPARAAALADGELPGETGGVPLLPAPQEPVGWECSCPGGLRPCGHAAALALRAARIVGAEPLSVLLVRGRAPAELREELGRRSAARAVREAPPAVVEKGAGAEPGPLARAALATRVRPALPPPLSLPSEAGRPPAPPSVSGGPDAEAVAFLAADAAVRAHAWLAGSPGDESPFGGSGVRHDAIRLAATHPELGARRTFSPQAARLAGAAGDTPAGLARAAAAWRQGGRTGLEVLESEWDPPAGDFDRARGLLAAAGLPRLPARRNRLTEPGGVRQLRYGRDGRWYPYTFHRESETWWPQGRAGADPSAVLRRMYDDEE